MINPEDIVDELPDSLNRDDEFGETENVQPYDCTSTAIVPYRSSVPALIPDANSSLEDYIRAVNAAPVLSEREEYLLAVRLRDFNDAQAAQELIISHLRLVVSIARGYLGYGLPHADLIQEGTIGLMKAVRHFDPDHGNRLAAFAQQWISAEIKDYVIKNSRLVRLATTKNQKKLFFKLRQMKNSTAALTSDAVDSIARTLDVKPEDVREMETRLGGSDMPLDHTDDTDTEGLSPLQYLSRPGDQPENILALKDREHLSTVGLQQALNELDERSRRVIIARHLQEDRDGNPTSATLAELAAEFGVSIERVRQIEKKAIAKMRTYLTAAKDAF